MQNKKMKKVIVGGIFVFSFIFIYFISAFDSEKYTGTIYKASFDDISGVSVGTSIYIAGVKIGSVRKTSYNTMNIEVDVYLEIFRDIKIPVDSSISVSSYGLFSDKVLNIEMGYEDEYMKGGDEFYDIRSSVDFFAIMSQFLDIKINEIKESNNLKKKNVEKNNIEKDDYETEIENYIDKIEE